MTEEIINCDFYNDKICNLFTEYFKFKVECKNLTLCTVENDTDKECPYKQLKNLEQENKALKDNNNHLQAIIDDGRAENKRFREENKLLRDSKFKELDRALEAEDKYKSALEEIRILATKNVSIENFVKIQNKINEVLNDK